MGNYQASIIGYFPILNLDFDDFARVWAAIDPSAVKRIRCCKAVKDVYNFAQGCLPNRRGNVSRDSLFYHGSSGIEQQKHFVENV